MFLTVAVKFDVCCQNDMSGNIRLFHKNLCLEHCLYVKVAFSRDFNEIKPNLLTMNTIPLQPKVFIVRRCSFIRDLFAWKNEVCVKKNTFIVDSCSFIRGVHSNRFECMSLLA